MLNSLHRQWQIILLLPPLPQLLLRLPYKMCMEAYVADVKRKILHTFIYDYVAVAIVVSDFSSPIVIIKMWFRRFFTCNFALLLYFAPFIYWILRHWFYRDISLNLWNDPDTDLLPTSHALSPHYAFQQYGKRQSTLSIKSIVIWF